MSQFTGMDINRVRQLAQSMNTRAQEIQQMMQQLTAQLRDTPWIGPDRARFESEWNSTMCSQLRNVADRLTEASQRAMQNAAEQEQVSNNL